MALLALSLFFVFCLDLVACVFCLHFPGVWIRIWYAHISAFIFSILFYYACACVMRRRDMERGGGALLKKCL